MLLLLSAEFFFKIKLVKQFFDEQYHSVRHFTSAKVINRRQKSQLAREVLGRLSIKGPVYAILHKPSTQHTYFNLAFTYS